MINILVIDDDSGRYDGLRRKFEGARRSVVLHVVSCADCIEKALPMGWDAVMLDHDLSPYPCPRCGAKSPLRHNGRAAVAGVAALGVPVIVTSASRHENRRALTVGLQDAGVEKVVERTAADLGCEERWIGVLWCWGVL